MEDVADRVSPSSLSLRYSHSHSKHLQHTRTSYTLYLTPPLNHSRLTRLAPLSRNPPHPRGQQPNSYPSSTTPPDTMGATASTPATPPPFSEKSQSYSHASSNTSSPASAADLLASLSLRAQSQRGGKASPASATITSDSLASWEQQFASNPKHKLASTVLSKTNFSEALVSREAQRKDLQVSSSTWLLNQPEVDPFFSPRAGFQHEALDGR